VSSGRTFGITLFAAALLVNEDLVAWVLAVFVGGYGVGAGFGRAFEYFTLDGYLLTTAARLVPYGLVGIVALVLFRRGSAAAPGVAWGGLLGVFAIMVWGLWTAQYPLYAGGDVSSTTAIAFLIVPVYAIAGGLVGALLGCLTGRLGGPGERS
jgi:hypothetical protein